MRTSMFVFLDSETTKNVLIASAYVHLKCRNLGKLSSELPTVSPRILLSGPEGNISPCFEYLEYVFPFLFDLDHHIISFLHRVGNSTGNTY